MLTVSSIPVRNLRYHWRGNLAVLLGVAVAAAVLTGALFVGDSLRGSLRDRGLRQLSGVQSSWVGPRLIGQDVAGRLGSGVAPAVYLQGTGWTDGGPTVSHLSVIGLDADTAKRFDIALDGKGVVVSAEVAKRLKVIAGDKFILSVQKGSNVPRSSLLGRREIDDTTAAAAITVATVLSLDHPAADFTLTPSPTPPLNVYVPLAELQTKIGQPNRVNALLAFDADAASLNQRLPAALTLPDIGLRVVVSPALKAYASVEAEQFVLDSAGEAVVQAAARELGVRANPTTAYLANSIWVGGTGRGAKRRSIPYSIIAGVEMTAVAPLGPFLPPGRTELRDDEIVLVDWADSPLKSDAVGTKINVAYFLPHVGGGVAESTQVLTLAGRIPLAGVAADPDLTPAFPGVTDKASIRNWDPPFPFDNSRIKPGDANEEFWKQHRTTPKAYITKAAADRFFGTRFGNTTSIRVAPAAGETAEQLQPKLSAAIQKHLDPKLFGVVFEPNRERVFTASSGSNDFAGLFLGFSLFLIVSALLLVGLLFRLTIERRAKEIGLFVATGYSPKTVRRLLLAEGFAVALIGTAVGVAVAVGYSRLLLAALVALWPDESVAGFLKPHTTVLSLVLGVALTMLTAGGTIALALRGLLIVPPPALLRGRTADDTPTPEVAHAWWVLPVILVLVGGGAIAFGATQTNADFKAGSFFGGGGMILAAGLIVVRNRLRTGIPRLPRVRGTLAPFALGRRNANRFPGRSLLTVALVAAASFLLVAVESFRRNPDSDFAERTGGSGGFNLIAEADIPLYQAFDNGPGHDEFLTLLQKSFQNDGRGQVNARLKAVGEELQWVRGIMPLRQSSGDDASCLNLYQAGRPRVLGIPNRMVDRGGFRFSGSLADDASTANNPWRLLGRAKPDDPIPVIVEQNTAMWQLKKGLGDRIDIPADGGTTKPGVIVATLQDSTFQSQLIVAEADYISLFPRDDGFPVFLLDTPPESEEYITALLSTAYRRNGLAVTPARDRVAGYQAVVGTYLTTFQLLGGLGLGLGILGVAVVILRGVWDRAGELALLRAFGYTTRALRLVVLGEYLALLLVGLVLGLVAAAISVAPHAITGGQVPWVSVTALVAGVLTAGVLVVTLATAGAARLSLVPALRTE